MKHFSKQEMICQAVPEHRTNASKSWMRSKQDSNKTRDSATDLHLMPLVSNWLSQVIF